MKKALLTISMLLMLGLVFACSKSDENDELINTSWKLFGFYSHEADSIEIAQPEDCEYCYVITFHEDGKISGRTTSNDFGGEYTISDDHFSIHDCNTTQIVEMYDGKRFYSSLLQSTRYSLFDRQLKLYYNNQDYLLFNVR